MLAETKRGWREAGERWCFTQLPLVPKSLRIPGRPHCELAHSTNRTCYPGWPFPPCQQHPANSESQTLVAWLHTLLLCFHSTPLDPLPPPPKALYCLQWYPPCVCRGHPAYRQAAPRPARPTANSRKGASSNGLSFGEHCPGEAGKGREGLEGKEGGEEYTNAYRTCLIVASSPSLSLKKQLS